MKVAQKGWLLLAFLLVGFAAKAQRNFTNQANKLYMQEEWFAAIEAYKKASTKEKNKTKKAEIFFRTGECYRHINDYVNAEKWYQKAIDAKYPDPIVYFQLGEMKKDEERYNDALVDFKKYKELNPSDKNADKEIKSCELSQKWKDDPNNRYKVENVAQINSKFEDFSPVWSDKKRTSIYFTSTREGALGAETDGTTGQTFSDLWEAKKDKKGKWSTPTNIGEPINSKFNEGAACMNKKATLIYFTRCDKQSKHKLGCQIMYSNHKGNGFEAPVSLHIVVDSLTVGHPALSLDESKLYFASDMPGGQGGKDLWYIEYDKKNKAWGVPVNLGPTINTEFDEMYPYMREDGILYFSSNGHIGMGGLDIFKCKPNADGSFGEPENLKFPLNSAADDFGILFRGKKESGYLSSNRVGGKGSDDIWEFEIQPLLFTLQGTITDVDSRKALEGATIKLVGSDGSSVESKTDANGSYRFELTPDNKRYIKENVSYTINVSKEKYFAQNGDITTVGLEKSENFDKSFALKTTVKPIRLPEILYDLAKWDLKPQFQDSLLGLVTTLQENQNLVVELGSHTDSRGDNKSNAILAQKRAQSVVDFLITKGIDADRLVARGYGEEQLLIKDAQIKAVKDKVEQEKLHALNRRTTFRVLREDFVPKADTSKVSHKVKIKNEAHYEGEEEEEEEEVEAPKAPENQGGTATPPGGTGATGTAPAGTGAAGATGTTGTAPKGATGTTGTAPKGATGTTGTKPPANKPK